MREPFQVPAFYCQCGDILLVQPQPYSNLHIMVSCSRCRYDWIYAYNDQLRQWRVISEASQL